MNVCLFGSAKEAISPAFKEASYELGRLIAANGHTLVFGAGTDGVMGAAARGATAEGGGVVGIVPTFFDRPGILYQQCTELVFTDDMWDRKLKFRELADCFVVAPGGIGTLDEFFEVLTLRNLDRHGKPIAILNTDNWFEPILAVLTHLVQLRLLSDDVPPLLQIYPDALSLVKGLGLSEQNR